MLGRTFLVVLFFWAALTIITPILVRMSATAKLLDYNGETKSGYIQSSNGIGLLSRRALGSMIRSQVERRTSAPAPAPTPTQVSGPRGQITFQQEVNGDTGISSMWLTPTYIQIKTETVT